MPMNFEPFEPQNQPCLLDCGDNGECQLDSNYQQVCVCNVFYTLVREAVLESPGICNLDWILIVIVILLGFIVLTAIIIPTAVCISRKWKIKSLQGAKLRSKVNPELEENGVEHIDYEVS